MKVRRGAMARSLKGVLRDRVGGSDGRFWRLARAQRFEVVETCRHNVFFSSGVDSVIRYSALMERVAEKAFDELANLDAQAAGRQAVEEY
jgi:hypothetical protein